MINNFINVDLVESHIEAYYNNDKWATKFIINISELAAVILNNTDLDTAYLIIELSSGSKIFIRALDFKGVPILNDLYNTIDDAIPDAK